MTNLSPNTAGSNYTGKKREKATPATHHRRHHRLDDMIPMTEPNADLQASLRASKRAKQSQETDIKSS